MPPEYTFLLLNASMRAVRRMDVVCLDDSDALALAEIIRERNHLEVWDGRRRVAVLDAAEAQEPDIGFPIDKIAGAEPEITFMLEEADATPRLAAQEAFAQPAAAAEPTGAPLALFKRLAGARGG